MDREIEDAERDASPQRFARRPSNEIERVLSASTSSISTGVSRGDDEAYQRRMSRVPTSNDLERHPTELSRIATHRSLHVGTVGSRVSTKSQKPLPNFGAGKPFPPPLPAKEEYVVEFDGPEDPMHAQNWPLRRKLLTGAMLGYTTLTSAFTSSIFSAATRAVAAEFGVGVEVGLLGTSFYVLGFATGPTLWAPLSELRGRRFLLFSQCSDSPSFVSAVLRVKISRLF